MLTRVSYFLNSLVSWILIFVTKCGSFGIVPASPLQVPLLMPSGSAEVQLPLSTTGAKQDMDPANALQIAIKNNNGVYYFQTLAPIHAVLVEDRSGVSSTAFEDVWSAGDSSSFSASVKGDDFIQKLGQIGVHYVEQVSSTVRLLAI